MDSEEFSFLEEIRLHPDDLIYRAIYADWLEECEDPRSEVVRIQCEMSELLPADPRLVQLKQRETELTERYENTWLAPVRRLGNPFIKFDRGLLSHVIVEASWFVEYSEALFQELPSISSVRLRNVRGVLDELALIEVAQLKKLDLSANMLSDEEVCRLASHGFFRGLTHLDLGMNRLFGEIAPGFQGRWPGLDFPQLQWLGLDTNRLGGKAVDWICLFEMKNSLRHIDLSRNLRGPHEASESIFSDLDRLPELRSLEVYCSNVSGVELLLLAGETICPNLRRLSLAHNFLDEVIIELLDDARFAGLTELVLSANAIDDAAAIRLARSKNLNNLRLLDLRQQRPESSPRSFLSSGIPFLPGTQAALRDRFGYAVMFDKSQ